MSYDNTEIYVLNFDSITHDQAAKHLAAFFMWAIYRNLLDTDFFDEKELDDIKQDKVSILEFFRKVSDYHLLEDMFNELGNEFIAYYYDQFYIKDYTSIFRIKSDIDFFNIQLSSDNINRVFHALDFRFSEWTNNKSPIDVVDADYIDTVFLRRQSKLSRMPDDEKQEMKNGTLWLMKVSNRFIFIGLAAGFISFLLTIAFGFDAIGWFIYIPALVKFTCGMLIMYASKKAHAIGSFMTLAHYFMLISGSLLISYSNITLPVYAISLAVHYRMNKTLIKWINQNL